MNLIAKHVPDAEAADLASVNTAVLEVVQMRKPQIDAVDEPYCRSKIAWKIAAYSNAMLYRFEALADGVALSWNAGNVLSAILNARSLIESTAVLVFYANKIETLHGEGDLAGIDSLSMNHLFGTKDEVMLATNPELKALHVLKAIDKIDKEMIPHFRSHYDSLSERCHPNAAGHRELFSKIDKERAIVTFTDFPDTERSFLFVKCALGAAVIFKIAADKIERLVPLIAAAHHAAHPSPLVKD